MFVTTIACALVSEKVSWVHLRLPLNLLVELTSTVAQILHLIRVLNLLMLKILIKRRVNLKKFKNV